MISLQILGFILSQNGIPSTQLSSDPELLDLIPIAGF